MYLKRLDLQGFKSFPEKIKLEFDKGITTVVGPNGSGKSNISDSVRWVLGEQRAKSLRGDKMEDIIFAGTSNRKPLGFAEVSITIDNQEGKMPIEYTEVTVTRRVFRSGESDYLINGTVCRLKDVHELFMDTGIGKEGYSIIGQGRIDEILSSKSEDRRRLFEEAAGIVKFKNRRHEATSKLEKESQNLTRIDDIINELENQVEPLKNQSEIAKKYLELKDQLKIFEINIFKIKYENIEEEIKSLDNNKEITSNQLKDETSSNEVNKSNLKNLKDELNVLTENIQTLNDSLLNITKDIEKNEGEIKVNEEQTKNINENIKRLTNDILSKNEQINQTKNNIETSNIKLTALDLNISAKNSELESKDLEFETLSKTLNESETQIENYKSDMIEKLKTTSELRENISRNNVFIEQFDERKNSLVSEISFLESQLSDAKTHMQALDVTIKNVNSENQTFLDELSKCRDNDLNIKNDIAKNNENLQQQNKLLAEKSSRLKVLSEMEKEHEGFFKSVKVILALKDKNPEFKDVNGALGEILNVPEIYETAIEVSLGGALQNIVTKDEQVAKKCILHLKNTNSGRATFLPISEIKSKEIPHNEKDSICLEEGIIGIAKDLIYFDDIYSNIVSSFLGRVIIAKDIDFAIKFSKKYNYKYKVVTLDGEILNAGGSMTGGSILKKTTNIFGRSREIKELQSSLDEVSLEISNIKNFEEAFILNQKNNDDKILEINEKIESIKIILNEKKNDLTQTEFTIAENEKKLNNFLIEKKQLNEQFQFADNKHKTYEKSLLNYENEIKQIEESLLSFKTDVDSSKDVKDSLLKEITDLKIDVNNLENDIQTVKNDIEKFVENIKNSESDINHFNAQIEQYKTSELEKNKDLTEINNLIFSFNEDYKNKQQKLIEVTEKRGNVTLDSSNLEEKINALNENILNLKNNITSIDSKKEKNFEDKNRITEEIQFEYNVNYESCIEFIIADANFNTLSSTIKNLKNDIKDLGAVNVESIETYKEVKERFTFLTTQREDILKAKKDLETIILELTKSMESQFLEQFKLISDNFNIVFKEMFGGGEAYLKLDDENNALETGIEIIAKPPGKNLQNMMLLSGGERALTAIAILFSILKLKPSPFCILDEIEAALDDANVKRYANYLRRFADSTQFIVITHRKGTMEAADVMYGITMQEQGVSTLVSVKFEEVTENKLT